MNHDAVDQMLPAAAALAVAVCDYDAEGVATVLTRLDMGQLHALAIALAANVDLEHALTTEPRNIVSEAVASKAARISAEMFMTNAEAVMSTSRRQNVVDARGVAMYACRLAGLSSPVVGAAFSKDHTTVLAAWGRIGENQRLRVLAQRVALQCGWWRPEVEAS